MFSVFGAQMRLLNFFCVAVLLLCSHGAPVKSKVAKPNAKAAKPKAKDKSKPRVSAMGTSMSRKKAPKRKAKPMGKRKSTTRRKQKPSKPKLSPMSPLGEKLDSKAAPKVLKSIVNYITGRKDHEQFAASLACSGCIWAGRGLRHSLSAKVKRQYKGDKVRARMKKEVDVRQGVDLACDVEKYPDEMSAVNPDHSNLTVFEYRPKDESLVLGYWPANEGVRDEAIHVCEMIMAKLAPNIVERTLWAKQPPWKLEWEKWTCQETLPACDDYWFKDKDAERAKKGRDEDDWWDEDEENNEL